MKRFFFLCFIVLLLTLFPVYCFASIYIDINAPSFQRFRTAIPDFVPLGSIGSDNIGAEISKTLTNDLNLSGYFEIMDPRGFIEQYLDRESFSRPRLQNWSVIRTDLLVTGGYSEIGDGLEIEFKLFDVLLGREIMGKRIIGYKNNVKEAAHRIADQILLLLAGHEGFFNTKIIFVSNSSGSKEIFMCNFDGSNPEKVVGGNIAIFPKLSHDGRQVAYNQFGEDGIARLFLKDLATGKITTLSSRKGLNLAAAWDPNGKTLVLTMSNDGQQDLYRIDLTGKIVEQITAQRSIDVSPCFSPDGQKIAFVSNRSGSPQIYIKNLLTKEENRLTFEGTYNTSPAWSSRGKIAFVSMVQNRFDIYTIEPNGSNLRKLTNNQKDNEEPSWSPDGRYIVFSSNRSGSYQLYITSESGQSQVRITNLKGNQIAPSWGKTFK